MDKKEDDETSYSMEGISFGLADGIICCLGLTIGVAEATSNASSREHAYPIGLPLRSARLVFPPFACCILHSFSSI